MKILFFEMKDVCYNSYVYFAESLAKAFEKAGHTVEFFRITEHTFEDLEILEDKSFDCMIDFNSDLPRALLDDDSYFLDHINAPFLDVLLDHPLYHHDTIKTKLKNFHLVVLDEFHKQYVEKYYPHIKSVFVCPMTGEKASTAPANLYESFEKRPYDLSFTGTYTAPERIEVAISKIPKFLQENVFDLIDIQRDNQNLSIEQAVEILAKTRDYDYIRENFALHTQSFYLADAYVRAENRKAVIKSLDKTPISFNIFGGLWEELNLKRATVHQEMPFSLSLTIFNHSKIVLNVMPNFKSGSHDRIYSGQLNGALVLTDHSAYLDREFADGKNILFYDITKPEEIEEKVTYALSNLNETIKMAQAGEKFALSNHTWANIYEVFIKEISLF